MINHDRLLKELLSTFFVEFLELFFPEVVTHLEQDSISFLEPDLLSDITNQTRDGTKLVVQAKFRSQDSFFLIYWDNHQQASADFSQQVFHYFSHLYKQYGLPVYPIAIFADDEPDSLQPNFHQVKFHEQVILEFNYALIQLNHLSWRNFVRQPNPVASALMARMNMAPEERPRVKFQCLHMLAKLSLAPTKRQFLAEFIDTYLPLNAEEWQLFEAEIGKIEPVEREAVMNAVFHLS